MQCRQEQVQKSLWAERRVVHVNWLYKPFGSTKSSGIHRKSPVDSKGVHVLFFKDVGRRERCNLDGCTAEVSTLFRKELGSKYSRTCG